jgi:hypothetical protein
VTNTGLGLTFGDHGYHDQIEAVLGEIMALERDGAWKYHSVKQNVLISAMKGASESSKRAFVPYHPLFFEEEKKQKEFQKVRGQGIVHAPPETTFNCISDLDMYDMWDGFSSEHTVIAEYPLSDQGLIRILYIRFNGIFPLASRDLCVCTVKRSIFNHSKPTARKSKDQKRASFPWPSPTSPSSSPHAESSPRSRSIPTEHFKINPFEKSSHISASSSQDTTPSPKETYGDADAHVLVAFSIDHPSCPKVPGYVRAELAASGFIIRPHAHSSCSEVTYILQLNAKGWLPTALASLVSEYQPLRIAKIRDIAHTYQYTKRSASSLQNSKRGAKLHHNTTRDPTNTQGTLIDTSALSSASSSSSSSTATRFGWMQQCRGVAREEEEFIALERQRLEDASNESSRINGRPTLLRGATQSTLLTAPIARLGDNPSLVQQQNLQPKRKHRHTRSASSGGRTGSDMGDWTPSKNHQSQQFPATLQWPASATASSSSSRSGSAEAVWASSSNARHSSSSQKSSITPLHMSDGSFSTGTEGEGGETEWSASTSRRSVISRPRSPRMLSSRSGVTMLVDSDSENGEMDVDSEDSEDFYDVSSDLHSTDLLQPGADGSMSVLKMMENDVEHIRGVQHASQERLEAIEDNLKNRSVDNARLLDHLDGLRAFLLACMEKLKNYSTEHKSMEAVRLRMESKWHAKLASVAAKLNEAQRGYWSSRRARNAVVYRYSTLFFILIVWPIIFIKLYGWFKKPQRALFNLLRWTRLFSDWLLPSIPFDSD